jgi:opine dehydrogenase
MNSREWRNPNEGTESLTSAPSLEKRQVDEPLPASSQSAPAARLSSLGSRSCGVVGAGNSAHALASYLARQGHRVHIYARNPQKVEHLRAAGAVRATGKVEGTFELASVGQSAQKFVESCSTIFVCTTTNDYLDVVAQIGPYLQAGHEVILFSSKFGGSLLVDHQLQRLRRSGVRVVETDALFACRLQSDGSVWVRGMKEWTLYSSPRASQTAANRDVLERFFPNLEAADNIVQRGLTDFGALTHALTVLVNINSIDRNNTFLFYQEGFTERTVSLLETMEREFREVARAYDTTIISASQLLNRYYGCETTSLLEAMRTVPNYRFSTSPESLHTRYIHEDVPCTLVPVSLLAQLAGTRVPVIDSVIAMASVIAGEDFLTTGRTLDRLGWGDFGAAEIRQWMKW